MARLPSGWHWINSRDKKQGAVNPATGEIFTRHQAETRGAQQLGFDKPYDLRKSREHVRSLHHNTSTAGVNYRTDLQRARDAAARRGESFDQRKFDRNLAALNAQQRAQAREAKAQFLYMTGRVDSIEQGLESA